MNRKIIDYIVVEVRKANYEENQYYSQPNKGNGLKLALTIKNIEDEIVIQENKKILLEEEIKYVDTLLQTVEDFSTYKVTMDEILFYKAKYNNSHPLEYSRNLEDGYKAEFSEKIKNHQRNIVAIAKKIAEAKSEIQKLKIEESAILENNQNLDFEIFRTDFEKSVIYYLEKGYKLQGGVSVSNKDSFHFVYCQAMIKYED
ncbi:hypothetical protein [Flavobacterium saccharophilum]|uniref:Uncharacterized protein n=1 Tax=Flavobacterium saccharophilum TaxID=29534 RepID=A0A1M7DEP6_9FLAO|nr:hypothetical protein [Flavobacterium saccharophilum]SHL77853.1 hypothetical protein SAMN05444366_1525 [Flavobacterium saccharophilum]